MNKFNDGTNSIHLDEVDDVSMESGFFETIGNYFSDLVGLRNKDIKSIPKSKPNVAKSKDYSVAEYRRLKKSKFDNNFELPTSITKVLAVDGKVSTSLVEQLKKLKDAIAINIKIADDISNYAGQLTKIYSDIVKKYPSDTVAERNLDNLIKDIGSALSKVKLIKRPNAVNKFEPFSNIIESKIDVDGTHTLIKGELNLTSSFDNIEESEVQKVTKLVFEIIDMTTNMKRPDWPDSSTEPEGSYWDVLYEHGSDELKREWSNFIDPDSHIGIFDDVGFLTTLRSTTYGLIDMLSLMEVK